MAALSADFSTFMFKGNIAAGAAAYAIGLASAELSKSLTMSALLPALRRTGAVPFISDDVTFDLPAIGTTMIYWISMICVSYVITEFVFGRWMTGTKTILDKGERVKLRRAQHEARTCPGLVGSLFVAATDDGNDEE
jgi:large-conductance mechanosensitive channel